MIFSENLHPTTAEGTNEISSELEWKEAIDYQTCPVINESERNQFTEKLDTYTDNIPLAFWAEEY